MTPEQLRIYNENRRRTRRPLIRVDGTESTDSIDIFQQEVNEVTPYTTGLQTTVDDPDYAKNIKQELDWISNSTQYLFNAVSAGQEAYNTAKQAASDATDAYNAAQAAQSEANDAAQAAIQAGKDALAAQTTANDAQEQVNEQVQDIQKAQDDATQALLDASSAAGIATDAGETAATAITNAATAQKAAEDAQDAAIDANSAAIQAQEEAISMAAKITTVDASEYNMNTTKALSFVTVPSSNSVQYVYYLNGGTASHGSIWFTLNGSKIRFNSPDQETGWITEKSLGSADTWTFTTLILEIPANQTGNVYVNSDSDTGPRLTMGSGVALLATQSDTFEQQTWNVS